MSVVVPGPVPDPGSRGRGEGASLLQYEGPVHVRSPETGLRGEGAVCGFRLDWDPGVGGSWFWRSLAGDVLIWDVRVETWRIRATSFLSSTHDECNIGKQGIRIG